MGKRAEKYEKLAETSPFFKKAKERKAEFYDAIAQGEMPDGFLSFTYLSPATNRSITRYFDTMFSSENFGSPISFGNMLETDVTEFFHHVPSTSEKIRQRLSGMVDDVEEYLKAGGDWFKQITEPKNVLGSDDRRCCCKSASECELLVAEELDKSRNPFKWGKAVCPSKL